MKTNLPTLLEEPGIDYQTQSSPMSLVQLSRKGIKKAALTNLANALHISNKELAKLLPVTERTLQRRASNSLLNSTTSQQAILIGQTITRGVAIFGSKEKFQSWVHQSNQALGGHTPLDIMDTTIGVQLVMDILGRLEHGVYS